MRMAGFDSSSALPGTKRLAAAGHGLCLVHREDMRIARLVSKDQSFGALNSAIVQV